MTMDRKTRKKLEADGWVVGTVQEFLQLSDAESEEIEERVAEGLAKKKSCRPGSEGLVHAESFMAEVLGQDLRKARQTARLTQAQLAEKIGKSRTSVSAAERGVARIGIAYVSAVLKACGLPQNWKGR